MKKHTRGPNMEETKKLRRIWIGRILNRNALNLCSLEGGLNNKLGQTNCQVEKNSRGDHLVETTVERESGAIVGTR